jgi:hypothetical protein
MSLHTEDDLCDPTLDAQHAAPLVLHGLDLEERAAALYVLYPLVCDLHGRYAQLQGRIRAAWWEREDEIELLAALCAQRALLDARAHQRESAADQLGFLLALPAIADHLTQSHGAGSFDPERDHAIFLEWLEQQVANEAGSSSGAATC